MEENITECLNCGAIWGHGSIDYECQVCFSCDWRPGLPTDEEADSVWPDDLGDDY